MNVPNSTTTSRAAGRSAAMSTAEIKSRVEAMFADSGPRAAKETGATASGAPSGGRS